MNTRIFYILALFLLVLVICLILFLAIQVTQAASNAPPGGCYQITATPGVIGLKCPTPTRNRTPAITPTWWPQPTPWR